MVLNTAPQMRGFFFGAVNLDEQRKLSDADIDALCKQLEERVVAHFHLLLGRGVVGFLWKIALTGLLGLIAYAISKGIKP